jgi:methionyl-tRNA formyltransferase
MRLTPPAIKVAAEELDLTVIQPEKVRSAEVVAQIRETAPDLIVVVAYGQIIPPSILEIPAQGVLNVHGSLLPRHRGAAPIAHAILAGDQQTGVTIMAMDELLDHGPIVSLRAVEIGPDEDAFQLGNRLAPLGAELLVETIANLSAIKPRQQDHRAATLAPKLVRTDGELSWTASAMDIDRRVRAFQPWPGVTIPWAGGRIKILRGAPESGVGQPGSVIHRDREGLVVATGSGAYRLNEVQVPGKRPMNASGLIASA